MKQLHDSPEKEEHKKITITINVQNISKQLPWEE